MRVLQQAGETIQWVAFPPAGGDRWSIITDKGFRNRSVMSEANASMVSMLASPGALRLVAYTWEGDGASVVGHVPEVVLTSTTPKIENVTSGSLTVTGQNLDRVNRVTFGSQVITSDRSQRPDQGLLHGPSLPRGMSVHPPQGLSLGFHQMKASSSWSVSTPVLVELTRPRQARLLASPSVTAGDPFSIYLSSGTVTAGRAYLVLSLSNSPSAAPGIVNLGLGNSFASLVIWPQPASLPSSSYANRFNLLSTPAMRRIRLYSQAMLVTRSFPWPVSNVESTLFR